MRMSGCATYHNVMSKMAWWSEKKVDGLQLEAGKFAIGVPHVLGCGAFAVMSEGMEFRGKNHTEIPVSSHFTGGMLRKATVYGRVCLLV